MIEEILKPTSLSSINQRVIQQMIIAMKRCETHQTPHHQLKCCGGQTVQTTSIVREQDTAKQRHSMFIGHVRERAGSALLHRKTLITYPVLTIIQTELQTCHVNQQMIGPSISVPLGRSTTITVGLRSLSGRNLRNGWRKSRSREKVVRQWSTAFPKTEITDMRRCRPVPQVPSVVQNLL